MQDVTYVTEAYKHIVHTQHPLRVTWQVLLPGAAGGTEFDISFLFLPRRSIEDTTYRGTHILRGAWRYVALTRARLRCYVLLECLTAAHQQHNSQQQKAEQWQSCIGHCSNILQNLGAEHTYRLAKSWHTWPSNIYTCAWWKATMLRKDWQTWARTLAAVEANLPSMYAPPATPEPTFGTMMSPATLQPALQRVAEAPIRRTLLPDLKQQYPTTMDRQGRMTNRLVVQAENYLEWARNFMLDAMCIHFKTKEITTSLPLLIGPDWRSSPDPSKVAHALFLCWLGNEDWPKNKCIQRHPSIKSYT